MRKYYGTVLNTRTNEVSSDVQLGIFSSDTEAVRLYQRQNPNTLVKELRSDPNWKRARHRL